MLKVRAFEGVTKLKILCITSQLTHRAIGLNLYRDPNFLEIWSVKVI